jgi:hypothetical protein
MSKLTFLREDVHQPVIDKSYYRLYLIAGYHLPNFASGCTWEGHQHHFALNSPLAEPAVLKSYVSSRHYYITFVKYLEQKFLGDKIIINSLMTEALSWGR